MHNVFGKKTCDESTHKTVTHQKTKLLPLLEYLDKDKTYYEGDKWNIVTNCRWVQMKYEYDIEPQDSRVIQYDADDVYDEQVTNPPYIKG